MQTELAEFVVGAALLFGFAVLFTVHEKDELLAQQVGALLVKVPFLGN